MYFLTSKISGRSAAVLGLVLAVFPATVFGAVSTNELIPNGDFEALGGEGRPEVWGWMAKGDNGFEVRGGNRVLKVGAPLGGPFSWERPGRAIGGAEYIFSFRVKGENLEGQRLALWNQLPTEHEPPGGPKFTRNFKGSFDWTKQEVRFRMPQGVTRFIVFFDGFAAGKGTAWFDDFSLRPVDDEAIELDVNGPSFGPAGQEQMTWIWSEPGFPWQGANMNKESVKPVEVKEVLFRRVVTLPAQFSAAQAVFVGDDNAQLTVNGAAVGENGMWQNIARIPLQDKLKPGRNEVRLRVTNDKGPAGLLARIEWRSGGQKVSVLTNGLWDCSADGGKAWKKAAPVALPVPALTQFSWAYPQLEKRSYALDYELPEGLRSARLAVRATGGVRLLADGKEIWVGASSGVVVKTELSDSIRDAKKLQLVLEDMVQPPFGQVRLQLKKGEGGAMQALTLADFRTEANGAPKPVGALYPDRTWPINVGSFEAAATRSAPDLRGRLEPWAKALLDGSKEVFRLGRDDDSSAEFGELRASAARVSVPLVDLKRCPRGLETKLRPELSIDFNLPALPEQGAALVLDVEDADSMVNSVGVFLNGVMCGNPQILGYDQIPGGRLTNRAWVVTIPRERFIAGKNTLTLRLLPSYYQAAGAEPENQAEEIIQQIGLQSREKSPYATSGWLHWDTMALAALAKPASEPINGRPVWMGTNMGYTHTSAPAVEWWNDFVLRDFAYLGLAYSESPVRFGIANGGQFKSLNRMDVAGLAAGQSVGDYLLSTLRDRGMKPYLLLDAGRDAAKLEDVDKSFEAGVVARYGQYFETLEIGNEVDNPYYNWNALRMAMAYATIQKQAAAGQRLREPDPDKNLKTIGEGWYHAWDFGVIDAQQRKESSEDASWTNALSAHNYGKSYIIPAVTYYTLYGVNPPKPIWVTECGSYTADDQNITDFDLNLRGNLGYATYIVQYLAHPYNEPMKRFSLFGDRSKNAAVLEKTRAYRRLFHAYALHGKSLAWRYDDDKTMQDKAVLVNPVDAGGAYKVSFVNFSREVLKVDVEVMFPSAGVWQAVRYGDGATVEAGSRGVEITAKPSARFQEMLGAGETVEYLIRK